MRLLFVLLLTAITSTLFAQDFANLPKGTFRPPMDIPFSISGSFAEVRSNHFHSGIDLRTGGKVGQSVYAVADGYLARVAISAWGGGKVLYIDHAGGLRTVYMHLNDFCGPIGEWVNEVQYKNRVFALDTTLPKGLIPIREGDLIAHSGNSGSSGGPHLHFEIRYSDNDQTINPFYFGFNYVDNEKPTIRNIKVYPADLTTSIEGRNAEMALYAKSKTVSAWRDTLSISGPFYVGIYATDRCAASDGKNGVERIELYVDGVYYWRYSVPSFRFEDTRCLNALIDYPQYTRNGEYYLLSRRLNGVTTDFSLPIEGGTGTLCFLDNITHKLCYKVYDFKGNCSERTFYVKRGNTQCFSPTATRDKRHGTKVSYRQPSQVEAKGFRAELKAYTLYCNDELLYSAKADSRFQSSVHTIEPKELNLPPHKGYRLSIATPPHMELSLLKKLVVVKVNTKGVVAQSSQLDGKWVVAKNIRNFGDFALMLDTEAPKVRAGNFAEGKSIRGKRLTIKVSDNLSGIASYHCFINGRWVLAEYDGKTATLYIDTSDILKQGENTLRCLVVDAVGNSTDLTWKRLLY